MASRALIIRYLISPISHVRVRTASFCSSKRRTSNSTSPRRKRFWKAWTPMECSKLRPNVEFAARRNSGLWARAGKVAQLAAAAVLFAGVLAGCRLDMHVQPKYVTEQPTGFFPDGRSERPLVAGTVPRGHLKIDSLLYTGMENGVESNTFPFPITRADLERGRERFNIYCTPCHDYTGNGN